MDGEVIPEVEPSSTKTFPTGLCVLVVDDNPTCLKILETMLKTCKYEVMAVRQAVDALSLLREQQGRFDLVMTDLHVPYMDGFQLLTLIGKEFEIPIIMMSAYDKMNVVIKGLESGASFHLFKPITMNDVQNLWQHVVRKKRDDIEMEQKGIVQEVSTLEKVLMEDMECPFSIKKRNWRKQEHRRKTTKKRDDCRERDKYYSTTKKKSRVVWNTALHNQFLEAIDQLGFDKAVPKKILERMNVPGIKIGNVASHLQKYRIFVKRIEEASQSLDPNIMKYFTNGALKSIFPSGHPLLNVNLQQGFPQFTKQQRTWTAFQPVFEGNIEGLNAPMSMPHGDPGPFLNHEASGSNSMTQLRCRQSLLMSNQGNLQQPLLGTTTINQQHSGSYLGLGMEPHSTRMDSSLRGVISTAFMRGSSTVQHIEPSVKPRLTGNGPHFNPTNKNYTGIQMVSTIRMSQMEPIDGEPSNNINLNHKLMDQIHARKMTFGEEEKSLSNHEFTMLSSDYATEGMASSNVFATGNQLSTTFTDVIKQHAVPTQPLPPPQQPQQQESILEDGEWEIDEIFDLIDSISTIENNSPPQLVNESDLGDLILKQIDQQQGDEEVMDPELDNCTYQLDDNTPSL